MNISSPLEKSIYLWNQRPNPELKKIVIDWDNLFFPNPWNKEQWENLDLYHLFIAQENDQPRGFLLSSNVPADTTVHLLKILVPPLFQHQGWGRYLLEKAWELLKQYGKERLYLEVACDNLTAIKFYQAAGLTISHRVKGFYGQGKDAFVMLR